jgi:hypothetical protein
LFNSSFSLGFKEKKATSDPEIKAEKSKRTKSAKIENSVAKVTGLSNPVSKTNEKKGSGSNV